jgi:hypothetical protein
MMQGQTIDVTPTPELNVGLYKTKLAIKTIEKNKEGHFGKYADLSTIEAAIYKAIKESDSGIDFHQGIIEQDTSKSIIHKVYTVIKHVSGEKEIIWGDSFDPNSNMQKKGSDETYAKRRSLEMAFGITASDEDDDNDEASMLQGYQNKEEDIRVKAIAKIKTALHGMKSDKYDLLFAAIGSKKAVISDVDKLPYPKILSLLGAVQYEMILSNKLLEE